MITMLMLCPVYEQECHTVQEEQCSTVLEQQCQAGHH